MQLLIGAIVASNTFIEIVTIWKSPFTITVACLRQELNHMLLSHNILS